jgi:glutamate-1-semialdehyde 2,1-aminomutase
VAAVIMEPAMCNTSVITPTEGYLEGVREVCSETGTILIFDEIITGFRLAPGGAQQCFGVTPDLATFGKAIGNGFPVSAVAGRADLMDQMAGGRVLHGGTYNAFPAAMAAVVATLTELTKPETFEILTQPGHRLMAGIEQTLAEAGVEARIQGFPQIFHVALGTHAPITNYRDSLAADKARYVRFTTALLEHGVRALERGAWFLSTAHTEAVIDETIEAVAAAAKEL